MATVTLFAFDDGVLGTELWAMDSNVTASKHLVADINPGSANSAPHNFVALRDGLIVFAATNAINGTELWATDGTPAHTYLVKDISASGGSNPRLISALGDGRAVFLADPTSNNPQLWITDGSAAGTTQISAAPITFGTFTLPPSVSITTTAASEGIYLESIGVTAPLPRTLVNGASTSLGTNNATFLLNGFGIAGDTVEIFSFATSVGTTLVQADGTWSKVVTLTNQGEQSFTAAESDAVGTSFTAPLSVIYDSIAPVVQITNGPVILSNSTSARIIGTSVDANSSNGVAFSVDGGAFDRSFGAPGGIFNAFVPVGTDGLHTVVAKAFDLLGNVSVSNTVTVDIDTILPVITLTNPFHATNTPTIVITGTVTDVHVGSTVQITDELGALVGTGSIAADNSFAVTTTMSVEGFHHLTLKTTDGAGNQGTLVSNMLLDARGPNLAITAPRVVNSTFTLSGLARDDLSPLQGFINTYIDGLSTGGFFFFSNDPHGFQPGNGYAFTSQQTLVGEGAHTILVKTDDNLVNTGTSNTLTVILDQTAPVIAIDTSVPLVNANAVLTGHVTDLNLGTSVSFFVDGSTTAAATTGLNTNGNWSGLVPLTGDGIHSIVAQTFDAGGNTGSSSAVLVELDATRPVVTITSPGIHTTQAVQTITGTATDLHVGATVSVYDSGAVTPLATATVQSDGTWSTSVTLVGERSHSLVAKNTDTAGNTGSSAAVVDVYDISAPVVTIANPSGLSRLANVTLTGQVSDLSPDINVLLYVDGSSTPLASPTLSGNNWSAVVTLVGENVTHTFVVKHTDTLGFTGTSNTVSLTLDSVAPVVTIANAGGVTNVTDQTLSGTVVDLHLGATVSLYDNGTLFGTATVQADGTWSTAVHFADGAHSIIARDTDTAGNVGSSAAVNYTIDTVAPVGVTLVVPATSDTYARVSSFDPAGLKVGADSNVSGLIAQDASGNLYGTFAGRYTTNNTTNLSTDLDYGRIFEISADKMLSSTLYTVPVSATNKLHVSTTPYYQPTSGGVTIDAAGNLYGFRVGQVDQPQTNNLAISDAISTIWELAAGSSTPTTVFTFSDLQTTDGHDNNNHILTGKTLLSLVSDAQGNLYGVNSLIFGASGLDVFKIDATSHQLTVLHHFDSTHLYPTAGSFGSTIFGPADPLASIKVNSSGDVFLTTEIYLTTNSPEPKYGAQVYEISHTGEFSTLADWTYRDYSGSPRSIPGGITLDPSGNIYYYQYGGTPGTPFSDLSRIMKIDAVTHEQSLLLSTSNGPTTLGSMIVDAEGRVFGISPIGGANNAGYLWQLKATNNPQSPGTVVDLHDFNANDGVTADSIAFNADGDIVGVLSGARASTFSSFSNSGGVFTYSSSPLTNVASHTLTGSGEAGSTITILDHGTTVVGTTTVLANRSWSVTVAPTAQGVHVLSARDTDAAGNFTNASGTVRYNLDSIAPTITPATTGGLTSNPSQTISGTISDAHLGTTIAIRDNGTGALLATATIDTTNHWTANITLTGDGVHTLRLVSTDTAGNTATLLAPVFDLDTTTPVTVITSPAVITNHAPVVTGTVADAHPGSIVSLFDNGSATPIATATVLANGTWSTAVTLVGEGNHSLVARNTDLLGFTGSSAAVVEVYDITLPVVAITSAAVLTASASQLITGTASDLHLGSTVFIYDNGSATALGSATVLGDGTWSTTVTLLGDGNHSLVARNTDAAGNIGSSNTVVDVLDTTAPVVVTTTLPVITNVAAQLLSGTVADAHPGSTVAIYDNGGSTPLATATLDGLGAWSTTVTLAGEGPHSLVVRNVDAVGNAGNSTAIIDIYDITAPAIVIGTAGGLINQRSQLITGTATDANPTTTVHILDGATEIGTTTVLANGSWSTTVTLLDLQGTHSLAATETDLAGNPGTSAAVLYTLDTIAPVVAITTAGGLTNSPAQVIAGNVDLDDVGSTVHVLDGATEIGTATVQADGSWTTTVTLALVQGLHSITATDTDPATNLGTSNTIAFTLDTVAPALVIATTGGLTNQRAQLLTGSVGTEDAGTTVHVLDGSTEVATATVQADGSWSTTVTLLNVQGTHNLSATDTDAAGNTASATGPSFTLDSIAPVVVIDTTGGPTNQLSHGLSGTVGLDDVGATVHILDGITQIGTATVQADGSWTTTVTLALVQGTHSLTATVTDPATNLGTSNTLAYALDTIAPVVSISTTAGLTNQANPTVTLSGLAEFGYLVTVLDGGSAIGTATVLADGTWSTSIAIGGEGVHTFTISETDIAGNTGTSSTVPYTIDTTAPAIILGTVGGLTNQPSQTISGTLADANPGALVHIMDGATEIATATRAGDGSWTATVTLGAQGAHVISATATDLAGNAGASGSTTFTLDTIAPSVAITSSGGLTNQASQTVSGTGESGTTVQLYDGAAAIGASAVVGAGGTWSQTITLASQGGHSITARDTDAAGNFSTSAAVAYTLDSIAPALVIGTAGGATNARAQTISGTVGTVDAGTVVHILAGTTEIGTATVNGAGAWSALVDLTVIGPQTLTVQDTDTAGNLATAAVSFDYTPIAIPAPAAGISAISGDIIVVDAAFAPLSGLTKLVLNGTGINTVTVASNAAAAFSNAIQIVSSLATGGSQIDGSALTAATTLTATGSTAADLIIGGAGDDVITGFGGADTMIGGAGNDTFVFSTLARLTTPGRLADGGAGSDAVRLNFAGAIADAAFTGLSNMEQLVLRGAGSTAVTLAATAAATFGTLTTVNASATVTALSLDATAYGAANAISVVGTTAADTILGGAGNDFIRGGGGADSIAAGAGNDTISFLASADLVFAGRTVNGGAGSDTLDLGFTGSIADSAFTGISSIEAIILSGAGATTLTLGANAAATMANQLLVTAGTSATSVVVNGSALLASASLNVTGSAGGDSLAGGAGNDTLAGKAGNDSLTGGAGVDRFIVDAGVDTVTDLGAGGADLLVVSAGATVNATLGATWTATAASSNAGTATLTAAGFAVNLAAATGSSGWTVTNAGNATAVSLIGSTNADTLGGGNGNDTLTGGAGIDTFQVTAGSDVITDLGQGGADVVSVATAAAATATLSAAWTATAATGIAGTGTGTINTVGFNANLAAAGGIKGWTLTNAGNGTAVALTGSSKADTLIGGAGNDTLVGGGGADRFQVTSGSDVITDLGVGGADILLVSAGATATATLGAAWTATATTTNAGSATITAAGFAVDLSAVTTGNGWTVTNAASLTGTTLVGSTKADTLVGGAGNDTLTGGAGIDTFQITAGTDAVTDLGSGGADALQVSAGATTNTTLGAAWTATAATSNAGTANITAAGFNANLAAATGTNGWNVSNAGNATAITLVGSSKDDTLTGGTGNDTLTGGAGIDSFQVTSGADVITDLGLGGAEVLVVSSGATASATLGAAWTATAATSNAGTAAITAAGFAVNLTAATGANGWTVTNAASLTGTTLVGSSKADTLVGGAGNDTLTGGTGNDTFQVTAGTDAVTDLGQGGADALQVSAGATANATLAAAWTATAATSNAGTATITAAGFAVNLTAATGANGWTVTNAASLTGTTLVGSTKADTLIGGAGNDTLTGGTGNDTFQVTAGTDVVTDLANGSGDALQVLAGATANATLVAAWTATALTSNAGSVIITDAGFAVDLSAATGGNGWNVSNTGNATAVSLTGSVNADTLTGGTGADTLIGGAGNDTLTGGTGIDSFQVTAGTDVITDLGNGGAEILVVAASATANATLVAAWTATASTSNAGSAIITDAGFAVDLTAATGIGGWNVSNAGNVTAVSLTGSVNADTLTGGSGADTLLGGAGNDTLTGGAGLDSFQVTSGSDVITDLALGGAEVLQVSAGATASATLGGAWTATASTSNAGTATITAAGFAVNLTAAAGANGWTVTNAASLTGTILVGSTKADTLIGGAGNDTLTGGAGMDVFQVTAGTDAVTDLASGGADALQVSAGATANATLVAAWTATALTSNAGTANITDAGFAVDLSAATGLNGWKVSNAASATGVTIVGSARADSITGGSGNDLLTGGAGADTLIGGSGNDTFVFNNQSDLTAAAHSIDGGIGTDFMRWNFNATVTDTAFAGTANIEQLSTNGAGLSTVVLGSNAVAGFTGGAIKVVATAGSLAVDGSAVGGGYNAIGGVGNDTFISGAGNDRFTSGGGNDVFVLTNGGQDIIVGFNPATGVMDLSGWAVHSYAALTPSILAVGPNTVISLDATHQVTLLALAPASLSAADFIFT